ncbi:MAG: translation initiation factor IF-3 [Candidatus Shikimatogenerans sp. JK-2022]|nr:translation initiation factor IF-3 [Candidatus Shikimatogenerans bostrichidophilus]
MLENKIYNLNYLLDLIKQKNIQLDLMLINDKNFPPLVKILNFNKYLYDFKKKYKKNFKNKDIKILRLSPQISDHDIYIKIKQAKKFLVKKYKVKFYVFFKGRSIIYKKKGENILMNCYNKLKKYGVIEKYPYMDYNKMFIIIKPKNY